MDQIGSIFSLAVGEALGRIDTSTLVFLTVANLVQVAIILFLLIVAPIWIIKHYNARRDDARGLDERQRETLEDLERIAERMEQRMATMESILESDRPNWKERT